MEEKEEEYKPNEDRVVIALCVFLIGVSALSVVYALSRISGG